MDAISKLVIVAVLASLPHSHKHRAAT